MAPTKFGLFKARSRDQAEQPSTENLLQSNSSDVGSPGSPVASTSKGVTDDLTPEEISELHIDSEDDEASENQTPLRRDRRRRSQTKVDDTQVNYLPLKHRASVDTISTSTLQDLPPQYDQLEETLEIEDDASTTADCKSLELDDTSIAPSEDLSVYCGPLRKPKKMRSWQVQQLRDLDMWQASNVVVMQNLLSRRPREEQIKWEAIATSRGLCTLTDNCTCTDCKRTKYLAGMADGDGGMGAAPFFGVSSIGCQIQ